MVDERKRKFRVIIKAYAEANLTRRQIEAINSRISKAIKGMDRKARIEIDFE